jgi:hypothetical protein
MEKTGLTTGIIEAVSNIADGQIGLRTKPIGIDPEEQILTELRMAVCKSAQEVYLEKQRNVLGEGTK